MHAAGYLNLDSRFRQKKQNNLGTVLVMAYVCDGSNCYHTDAWNSWGRWLLLGLIIVVIIITIFVAFWAMSLRRIRNCEPPIQGTGWMFPNPYRDQMPLYPKVPLKDVYPPSDPFVFSKSPSFLSSPEIPSPSSSRSRVNSKSESDCTDSLPSVLLKNPQSIPEETGSNTDLPLPKTRYR